MLPGLALVAPGLALVAALVGAAFGLSAAVPLASPLIWAIVAGAAMAPAARRRPATRAGVSFASRRLLRAGVALLGLRVSLGDLASLGPAGLGIAAGTIAVTMLLTTLLGRRLGVRRELSLLIATGSAVCGASAIAAMDSVASAREDEIAYAVATVTVFGSAAMMLIPGLGPALGLSDAQTGLWAGASIHEVAQVTAAGAAVSVAALKIGTLVKLARVVMLAPTVAVAGAVRRAGAGRRLPRVPAFVAAFLGLVVVRSVVHLPAPVLDGAAMLSTVLLAAALAGLGLGIDHRTLRGAGLRPLLLGLAAWLIAAATAFGLVRALG